MLYSHAAQYSSKNTIYTAPTLETSSIEISDADEVVSTAHVLYRYGPTYLTETMESSDSDEFQMNGPPIWTKQTFSIETSDNDEFIASSQMGNSLEDFDEILLL